LLLTPPGAGKSTICKMFSYLTYYPLEVESITTAKLESVIKTKTCGSLIVGDFARMSRDPIMIKVIEGLLGEEKKISRQTMRGDAVMDTEMIGLLAGVCGDLSGYMTSGLIFRLCPVILFHSADEHENIGKYINNNIGINNSRDTTQEFIKEYYASLYKIQTGESKKIKPVIGYEFDNKAKEKIYNEWNMLTKKTVKDTRLLFFRELHEGYRFLVSHSFLNVYNREVVGGKLIPNKEDLDVALRLMKSNIILKRKLLRFEGFTRNLKSIKDLDNILNDAKVSETDKGILKSLVYKQENKKFKKA